MIVICSSDTHHHLDADKVRESFAYIVLYFDAFPRKLQQAFPCASVR